MPQSVFFIDLHMHHTSYPHLPTTFVFGFFIKTIHLKHKFYSHGIKQILVVYPGVQHCIHFLYDGYRQAVQYRQHCKWKAE